MATVTGLREVRRALRRFPQQARAELKAGSERLAGELKVRIVAAAASVPEKPRQAALAARDVRIEKKELPIIVAGGRRSKASRLVFGTEYGVRGKFGWYHRGRYFSSEAKQFPPHRGRASNWFHVTVDRNRHAINAESSLMAADLVRRWSA